MNKIIAFFCLFLAISCGSESKRTETIDMIPNGSAIKWQDTAFPIVINVSESLNNSRPDLTAAIESAARTWSDAVRSNLGGKEAFEIRYISSIPIYTDCQRYIYKPDNSLDNIQTFLFNNNWSSFTCNGANISSGTLAITLFGTQNGILKHIDMIFNDSNFNFDSSPVGNEMDLESVVLHEMGHALGLKHVCANQTQKDQNPDHKCVNELDGSSVMNPTITYAQEKRSLSSGDVQRIIDLYND